VARSARQDGFRACVMDAAGAGGRPCDVLARAVDKRMTFQGGMTGDMWTEAARKASAEARKAHSVHVDSSLASVGVTPHPKKTYYTEGGGGHHTEQTKLYPHEMAGRLAKQGFGAPSRKIVTPSMKTSGGRSISADYEENYKHPSGMSASHSFGNGPSHVTYSVPPKGATHDDWSPEARAAAAEARKHPSTVKVGNSTYSNTGKTGTHIASGEKNHAEYAELDKEGNHTGKRMWRTPSGKMYPD
jgi:hypothetical protein